MLKPRNHLDKLWFTFSEEDSDYKISIFFSQKLTKYSTFHSEDRYDPVFVKISYYDKNMPYIYSADLSQIL